MKITLTKRLCLTAMLTLAAAVYTSSAFAETSKLVIESGDSAQSRQQAAMERNNGTIRVSFARKSTNVQRKSGTKPIQPLIAVINANRALILMRTGNLTHCAALTAVLAAPLPHNHCTLKDIERIRYD